MRDNHRQRIFMLGANVNEMNVEPVDFGDEVRHGVDLHFALPPIMLTRPVLRELLHGCELDALRCIRDRFPLGPLGRRDASAEVGKRFFRSVKLEGADCGGGSEGAHWTGGSPGRFCSRAMIGMSLSCCSCSHTCLQFGEGWFVVLVLHDFGFATCRNTRSLW